MTAEKRTPAAIAAKAIVDDLRARMGDECALDDEEATAIALAWTGIITQACEHAAGLQRGSVREAIGVISADEPTLDAAKRLRAECDRLAIERDNARRGYAEACEARARVEAVADTLQAERDAAQEALARLDALEARVAAFEALLQSTRARVGR